MGMMNELVKMLAPKSKDHTDSADDVRQQMAQFKAAYKGKVFGTDIPRSVPVPGGMKRPVSHYIRIEYKSGDTTFTWFADLETAQAAAANVHPNVKRIVGPHKLPTGRSQHFK